MNLQTIEFNITDPYYCYHSDEVNEATWSNDKIKLEELARREGMYFFTWRLMFPSDNGTKMFAISDEYEPESSLEYDVIYNPKA